MGYLDDLKNKNKNLHESVLGYQKPKGFDSANKEALKKLILESKSVETPVVSIKKTWMYWAIAASLTLFVSLRLFNNNNTQITVSEEDKILLQSLFVEDDQIDQFLDDSLSELLIDTNYEN